MPSTGAGVKNIPYLRQNFYLTLFLGFGAGLLLMLPASLLIGAEVYSLPFLTGCLLIGFMLFVMMFLLVRFTLKRQLRRQLQELCVLTGETMIPGGRLETMDEKFSVAVTHIDGLIRQLLATTDRFAPHCRALTEVSLFLSERAKEGLDAAAKRNNFV